LECQIEGCAGRKYCRGWCKSHYSKWWRYGDPTAGAVQQGKPLEHFRSRLAALLAEPSDECEIWPYGLMAEGYGCLVMPGRDTHRVHRMSLIEATGTDGDVARHRCRNIACFNPSHLEWGTVADNTRDKYRDDTMLRGARHPLSKLTDESVVEMRRLREEEGMSFVKIAAKFGVAKSTTMQAVKGRTWAHVKHEGTHT